MSQESLFNNLIDVVSKERFESYREGPAKDDLPAWERYLWNIALSETLYPSLNFIEVALRNRIHSAAAAKFGDALWINVNLKWQERERLERWRKRNDPYKVTVLKPGDIVAGMTLGFWIDLFKGRYEQVLWPALLAEVFPYATKKQRHREGIYQRLAKIQGLRNRVFHHEPIWHLPDLEEQHRRILETIGWISPAMLEMAGMLDRFDSVYTMGPQRYTEELDSVALNWGA